MYEELIPPVLLLLLYTFIKVSTRKKKIQLRKTDAIFITGCDSGIGYSLAHYCQELGMTVLAGCLQVGEGAAKLEELENVHVIPIDVTNAISVRNAAAKVRDIFGKNTGTVLKAIINNAGIMIFGEFAWQTDVHVQQQLQVNLLGAMNVTHALLPLIREGQGRIINICSHCSLKALPGLSVYSASKAGLLAWTDALRMELKKFKVPVISFIPGSFPFETNILSSQAYYASEMENSMSKADWKLYKSYFRDYYSYLTSFNKQKGVQKISDKRLYKMFDDALRLKNPNTHYCYSNWRYWFYHLLFRVAPTRIHDYLVLKFISMPRWKKTVQ